MNVSAFIYMHVFFAIVSLFAALGVSSIVEKRMYNLELKLLIELVVFVVTYVIMINLIPGLT